MHLWQRNGVWYVRRARRDVSLRSRDRGEAERNLAFILAEESKAALPTITVGDLAHRYIAHLKGRPSYDDTRYCWKALKPYFGPLKPDAIPERIVTQFGDEQEARGLSDGRIWQQLNRLRSILAFGMKRIEGLHASHIEIDYRPGTRLVFITKAEARKLLAECQHHHLRLAVFLMMQTAQRYAAIHELTWDRVDFDTGLIDFGADTGRKRRATVPMSGPLRAELRRARELARSPRVIEWGGHGIRDIRNAFNRAAKRAGLEYVNPHDLRRSAARWMIEGGRSIEEVAEVLGHTNTKTTWKVYARFSPDYLKGAIDTLDLGVAEVGENRRKA